MKINLDVQTAQRILFQIDSEIYDSIINGYDVSDNLTIICSVGNCNNLSINTSEKYTLLEGISYGCKTINIFTRIDANDIDIKVKIVHVMII